MDTNRDCLEKQGMHFGGATLYQVLAKPGISSYCALNSPKILGFSDRAGRTSWLAKHCVHA